MKSIATILSAGVTAALGVLALAFIASRAFGDANRASADQEKIERGRYLVHHVGMCIDCHSPRNEKGEFIKGKHLTGSPVAFASTVPMPWSPVAPRITGLPAGFGMEDMVHFLMTGERPNGRPVPLPPMPSYRLARPDAEAVAFYLRSLAMNAE